MSSLSLTKPITFGKKKTSEGADAVDTARTSGAAIATATPGLGGVPRANLLPPSVLDAAKGRRAMRGMMVGLAFAVVVAVAGSAAAGVFAMSRSVALAMERANTDTLLAQQLKYSDVSTTLSSISTLTAAQQAVGATDVVWADYLASVRAALPAGVQITNISVEATSPTTAVATGATALSLPRAASLSLTVTSGDLASVRAWMDNLAGLPGYADALLGSVTLSPEGVYESVVSLGVNGEIYSGRFTTTEDAQ
ncbi:hypothetical protein ACFSBZ_09780 [Amnibacterium flavum]|uniref:Fimbrial assembly protein n=1 Tax=Amnibacterium flavum TaxID=2173173 RepID=A0A2V1HXR1_9MICO|nr:hypothetical protein [Amnibacterium flavum]PVZ95144.1 hypothetical protein DDQ50_01015 [Amnibacterium flavum]